MMIDEFIKLTLEREIPELPPSGLFECLLPLHPSLLNHLFLYLLVLFFLAYIKLKAHRVFFAI